MTEENGVDASMEAEASEETKEEQEQEGPSRLLKGRAHFYFNVNHSLRMVLVKPVSKSMMANPQFTKACHDARTFTISKNKQGEIEAALYYKTMNQGDTAFLDLKNSLSDEECVVTHPNFMLSLSAGQYWSQLSSLSSVAVPPISTTEAKLETLFSRQIILEKAPELTDEQLYEHFPEACSVLTYPHAPNIKGIYMLEFKNDVETNKFMKSRISKGEVEIDGVKVEARLYGTRMQSWKREKRDESKEPLDLVMIHRKLEDEERIDACKRLHEVETLKLQVINKTDLFSDEKIVELIRMHNELQPLKESIKGDTNRRKSEKLDFPEPEELRTAYTRFALSPGYQKKIDAKLRQKSGGYSAGGYPKGLQRGKPYDNRGGYGRGRSQGTRGSYAGNYSGNRGYGGYGGNTGDQLTKAIEGLADALSGNMMGHSSSNNYGSSNYGGNSYGSGNYGSGSYGSGSYGSGSYGSGGGYGFRGRGRGSWNWN